MRSEPDSEMGRVIRAAFHKAGMSIKALSDQSGVPYATTYDTIKGARDPALSSANGLCKILGLELRPVQRAKRKGKA